VWRDCRLKWYLTFQEGFLTKQVNPNFWLGTLVHQALSSWYLKETTDPAHMFHELGEESIEQERQAVLEASGQDLDYDNVEDLLDYLHLGTVMLEGYQDWDAEHRDFDVIDSELAYYLPLTTIDGQGFTFVARLDLISENSDGIRPIDFKTAKDFRAIKTLDQDMQFRRYPWVMRMSHPEWAEDVIGSIWLGLRKIAPSNRSKPPYFGKEEVDLTDAEFEGVGQELIAEVTEMLAVERRLDAGEDHRNMIWPTPTFDCSWKCTYFRNGLCQVWRAGLDVRQFGDVHGTFDNDPYAEYKEDFKGAVSIGRREGGE